MHWYLFQAWYARSPSFGRYISYVPFTSSQKAGLIDLSEAALIQVLAGYMPAHAYAC